MTQILAIETSCDDTGVAVVRDGRTIVVNELASQDSIHAEFGGVVPEIASRQHIKVISRMTERALAQADSTIHAVAATNGPGLMGALLVGVNFAKALAYARDLPFIPIHHIEGHIFSVFLDSKAPEFPFLALIVSGGHTSLIMCHEPHNYETLGNTRDDAVGECFDKVARLLDLPYPGGPSIQNEALNGNPRAVDFPRPLANSGTPEFSYSGLKTAVLYELKKDRAISRADIAASFQAAAVDVLLIKTKEALRATGAPSLILAGGVAANTLLRSRLDAEIDVPLFMPPIALCADNAAMIAAAAHSRLMRGHIGTLRTTPHPNLAFEANTAGAIRPSKVP